MPYLVSRTSSTPEPISELELGERVMIRGLVARSELNGFIGEVCTSVDAAKGRIGVRTVFDRTGVSVRVANLQGCGVHPRTTVSTADVASLVALLSQLAYLSGHAPNAALIKEVGGVAALEGLARDGNAGQKKKAAIALHELFLAGNLMESHLPRRRMRLPTQYSMWTAYLSAVCGV